MKNERVKILFGGVLFYFAFSILAIWITRYEYQSYKNSVNTFVYGVVDTLKKSDSNFSEEKMIELLNNDKNIAYDDLFKKYGITEDSSVLYRLELSYRNQLYLHLFFVFLGVLSFFLFFFWYFSKKERRIKEITNYMREINRKNYILGIEENGEGELSILQNEVYKTTIMLREESEYLKKEKLGLKDSISDISHQLKTPLTSILIMLDNILDNPNMDENTKNDFIVNVRHQVENINFLIVSLLKLSRFDANVVEFKREKIHVSKLIEAVVQNVEVLREVKNIEIKVAVDKKATFIGDYHWELEAITNIVKNAIEHSEEQEEVIIKVVDNTMYTKIVIQDHGVGMSEKDLKNIFKRFYKGEDSSNDSIGIGLNLAKNIIEKDNGYIKVDSKRGVGTIFEIRYMR